MRVLVCGGGMVGGELAKQLMIQKHDVIVVDESKDVCDSLYAEIGVIAITGNSALLETLKVAEIDKADLVIAATNKDADNLSCAILAKSMGVSQIITRVNNPAYASAYELVGVTALVWGTNLVVNQMLMEIEHPRAKNITTIGEGRANIFSVTVPENSALAKRKIKDIAQDKSFPDECVFISTYKPSIDDYSIPKGDTVICVGDELIMISSTRAMEKAIDAILALKPNSKAIKS